MSLSLADELSAIDDDPSTSESPSSLAPGTVHAQTGNKPILNQHQQHPNENTPLAKYLTRIQNRGANAQEDEESDQNEQIHGEEEKVNGHAVSLQTTDATASPSSSSALLTLALLLLEFISPLLASLLFPESTLTYRARTWNITVCRSEVEMQQQMNQQHNTTVTREYIQKQMRYLGSVYRMILLSIVIQIVVFACFILSAWLSSSTSFLPLSCTTPLLLHSLLNLLLTLHSNHSSFYYHSFSFSFLTYFQLTHRSEVETKKLIMNLIEVELVRRGYYLNSSKKLDATMINVPIVIQKMEGATRNMRQDESRNTLLRHDLKSILEQEIFLMKQVMSEIQMRMLSKDAGLDGGASLQTSSTSSVSSSSALFSSPSASSSASSSSSSSSSPSIVELKSLRTQWLNQRVRLIHSTMELLEKVMSNGAELSLVSIFMSYLSSSSSSIPQLATIESYLSHAYLRLNMLLSQNHERVRDFLPEPLETTTSSVTLTSSTSSSPAHRASLQTSLLNLRDSIRSIERRIELALERGASMKRSDDGKEELKPAPSSESSTAISSVHDLFVTLSFSPLPSFTDFSSSSSSPASSSPYSNLNHWSSTLSTSLTSDLSYFRTIYRQFQTQCDRLERDILVCDKAEGVERKDGDGEKVMEALEPSIVNESESSSSPNADASVTPADLIAAMRAMRKKTPEGMGALFEGDGQFEEREFQPRRSAVKSSSSSAPAAPAVSIFTILAELKSVLQQRKPAYEYVSHAPAETESKETTSTSRD